jgi:hypothetical protein
VACGASGVAGRRLPGLGPIGRSSGEVILAADTSKTLQEIGDEFHMMMGYCIAEWSKVENAVYKLCQYCIGYPEHTAIIYLRTPTLDSRLKLVDELVRLELPKKKKKNGGHDHKDVELWSKLIADVGKLLKARNMIAHQPVVISRNSLHIMWETGIITKENALLYTRNEEILRDNRKKIETLGIEDLRKHLTATIMISQRFREFLDVLREHTKQHVQQQSQQKPETDPQSPPEEA